MRSNTENEENFLQMLRVTPLKQARARLVEAKEGRPVAACCLGVGMMMMPDTEVISISDSLSQIRYNKRGFSLLPSKALAKWLGYDAAERPSEWNPTVDWPDGLRTQGDMERYDADGELESYAEMNDSHQFTFAQIADVWAYFGVKP